MKLQDLFESSVDGKPLKSEKLEVKQAIAALNKHCRGSLWMLHENKPIWRGFYGPVVKASKAGFAIIDTSKSERKSQNTGNWYTRLFDTNPANAGWPKRSKSLICSTSKNRAEDFVDWPGTNRLFAIVPFDNALVANSNVFDIWDVKLRSWGTKFSSANNFFRSHVPGPSSMEPLERLQKFSDDIRNGDKKALEILNVLAKGLRFSSAARAAATNDLLAYLYTQYDAKKLGFKKATGANFKSIWTEWDEVWVEGKVIAIRSSTWNDLLRAHANEAK